MTRTALLLAALAAIAVLAAACGGPEELSGDPDVPDGWQTVREGPVSFAVPGDWRVETREGTEGATVIEARGPGDEQLAPSVRVLHEVPPGTAVGAQLALRETADERLPNAELEEPREVELEGAERAERWTTTYETPVGAGRIDGIAAQREDGSSVNLRATAAERSDVDTAAIADSLRLGG